MDIIHEKRSNPELNPKVEPIDQLKKIFKMFPSENIFISFRQGMHVTDINPKNRYNTPTGFYTYPASSYNAKIKSALEATDNPMWRFRGIFPFASSRKFITVFVTNDSISVLDSNTTLSEVSGFVQKLKQNYNIPQIQQKCEEFLTGNYTPEYEGGAAEYSKTQLPCHLMWLFLYGIASLINKKNAKSVFTKLCFELGIDGFSDDKGLGWIHPAEKFQAVFFRVKNKGRVFVIDTSKAGGKGDRAREIMYNMTTQKAQALYQRGKFDALLNSVAFNDELFEKIGVVGILQGSPRQVEAIKTNGNDKIRASIEAETTSEEDIRSNPLPYLLKFIDKDVDNDFLRKVVVASKGESEQFFSEEIANAFYDEWFKDFMNRTGVWVTGIINAGIWYTTHPKKRYEIAAKAVKVNRYTHKEEYCRYSDLIPRLMFEMVAPDTQLLSEYFSKGGDYKTITQNHSVSLMVRRVLDRIIRHIEDASEDFFENLEYNPHLMGHLIHLHLEDKLTDEIIMSVARSSGYPHPENESSMDFYDHDTNMDIENYEKEASKLNETTTRLYDLFNKLNGTNVIHQ
jgi:hypothetical protein